jgi:hypothetical protein
MYDSVGQLLTSIGEGREEIQYRRDRLAESLSINYPRIKAVVGPTKVGNILMSVDTYCEQRFGMETSHVLSRMLMVMDPTTRTQLERAHDRLAFLEWNCVGVAVVGLIGTATAIGYSQYYLAAALWFALPLILWHLLYPATVGAARGYAAILRLALESERGKVISRSGLEIEGTVDQQSEKKLWERLTQWWVYAKTPLKYKIRNTDMKEEDNTKADTN